MTPQRKPTTIFGLAAFSLILILLFLSGCNLPQAAAPTAIPLPPTAVPPTAVPPTEAPAEPQPIAHQLTPDEAMAVSGEVTFYDVNSSGTGGSHYAPYGDSYDLNRLERPFTQADMTYQPGLDIVTFQLAQSADWNYAFIQMKSSPLDKASYGVELDLDRDGFGDILIWAQAPFSTQWNNDTLQVYLDKNHDNGGANPSKSDAPYPGDGYEVIEFQNGKGSDPDLAWVRLAPDNPSMLEFAFKRSLTGDSFMWSPWADAGLNNPAQFNYNDRMTLLEAGSPVKENPYYPVKALFSMDNSCRAYIGFSPTGYEPLLCFYEQPTPTLGPGDNASIPNMGLTPGLVFIPICLKMPDRCVGELVGWPVCDCVKTPIPPRQ